MTSKEINDPALERTHMFWLREIAHQLAVHSEILLNVIAIHTQSLAISREHLEMRKAENEDRGTIRELRTECARLKSAGADRSQVKQIVGTHGAPTYDGMLSFRLADGGRVLISPEQVMRLWNEEQVRNAEAGK